jgi:hypothetical protein
MSTSVYSEVEDTCINLFKDSFLYQCSSDSLMGSNVEAAFAGNLTEVDGYLSKLKS